MQYRSFFFLLAFGWMVPPLVYLFVWSTAAGGSTVGGMSRGQFIGYYLVLILVNQLTYAQTNWTVGDLIRDGSMTRLLLYPMSPLFNTVASEIAGKFVYMLFVIPVTGALALLMKPELNADLPHIIGFCLALIMAWLLRFLWGYWLALLAFWLTRADALLALQDALVFLLAGQVAPIALLPAPIRTAAVLLPFRYMVSFPVEILTGQAAGRDVFQGFLLQSAWLLLAALLCLIIWRKGIRHYAAVGG
jgi:ABC-2 type transport system permease protein